MPVATKIPSCPHNHDVLCEVHKCTTCGWNPEVSALRRLLLRKFGTAFLSRKDSPKRSEDHG